MKTKDYIGLIVIFGLVVALFLVNESRVSLYNKLDEKDEQIKDNLYQIDSLHYEYDKLEMRQDTLEDIIRQDSILLEQRAKERIKLYKLLKDKNEEIDNSSANDDYQYLLHITE